MATELTLQDLTKDELITLLQSRCVISEREIAWRLYERYSSQAEQLRLQSMAEQDIDISSGDWRKHEAAFMKSQKTWQRAESVQRKADKYCEMARQ